MQKCRVSMQLNYGMPRPSSGHPFSCTRPIIGKMTLSGPPWRRLARHHPRRKGGRQLVVADGVTKARREHGDVDGRICWHLLAAMVVASSSHKPRDTGGGLRFCLLTLQVFTNQTLHVALEPPVTKIQDSQSTGRLSHCGVWMRR